MARAATKPSAIAQTTQYTAASVGVQSTTNAFRIAMSTERAVWNADAGWASTGRIYDAEQRTCGSLKCSPFSFCRWQQWDLGVPCTQAAFATQMFQIDRFVWAQTALKALLAAMPAQLPAGWNEQDIVAGGAAIRRQAQAWAQWCWDVQTTASLLEWASNLRWKYAEGAIYQRGTSTFLAVKDYEYAGNEGSSDRIRSRMHAKGVRGPSAMHGWRPGLDGAYRVFDGNEKRPTGYIHFEKTVPRSKTAFEPSTPKSMGPGGTPPLHYYGRSTAEGLSWFTAYFLSTPMVLPTGGWDGYWPREIIATALSSQNDASRAAVEARLARRAGDQNASLWWLAPTSANMRGQLGYATAMPSPLLTVRSCIALAQDLTLSGYGDVMAAGVQGWLDEVLKIPEEMRPLNSAQGAEIMRGIAQAKLNEQIAIYSATAGAITGVVTAINPIAGVVVGLVLAIGGLVMQFALELGIAHPTPPPCPAPPFLRVIEPESGGLCDFSGEAAAGRLQVATRVVLIRDMAALGLRPEEWYTAIEAAEAGAALAPPPSPAPAALDGFQKPALAVIGSVVGLIGAKFFIGGGL